VSEPNYWLTCIVVEPTKSGTDRERIRLALEKEQIESRPLWKPMHLQPVFRECPAFERGVSEGLFRDGLCLPSGSALTEAQLERLRNRTVTERMWVKGGEGEGVKGEK
jgi:dTDP-4-amino-4,6-dideoxygalactose transaminase